MGHCNESSCHEEEKSCESSGCCSENQACCEEGSSSSCGSGSQCGPHECEDKDPLDKLVWKWMSVFMEAKHEVQLEIMKTRIQKAWGPRFEKAADAILEGAESMWRSSLTKSEAHQKIKEKLKSILFEGQK